MTYLWSIKPKSYGGLHSLLSHHFVTRQLDIKINIISGGKTMKKSFITLVLVLILACAMISSTLAASYTAPAEQLSDLGLLRGVDGDFQLGRNPTRAEAVTMLVRFLGLEEEALAGDFEHPFTDLPDWAIPYISIAYELGYTTGVTDTLFDPTADCSAQMFVTFILRALGYSDDDAAGASLWSEAIDFGKKVGVVDDLLLSDEFLRGHMAAVSFLALFAEPAGAEYETLLGKLVADGVVSEDAAKLILEKLNMFNEFTLVGSELSSILNIAMTIDMNMDITIAAMGVTESISVFMDMKMTVDEDGIKYAILTQQSAMGEDVTSEMYAVGDYIYINNNGDKSKMPVENSLGVSLSDLFTISSAAEMVNLSGYKIYSVNSIEKSEEDGLAVYSVELSGDAMNAAVSQSMGMMGASDIGIVGDMTIGGMTIKAYANEDGELVKATLVYDGVISLMGAEMLFSIAMDIEITAKGDDVVIEFPDDLDDYAEIEEAVAAETAD